VGGKGVTQETGSKESLKSCEAQAARTNDPIANDDLVKMSLER